MSTCQKGGNGTRRGRSEVDDSSVCCRGGPEPRAVGEEVIAHLGLGRRVNVREGKEGYVACNQSVTRDREVVCCWTKHGQGSARRGPSWQAGITVQGRIRHGAVVKDSSGREVDRTLCIASCEARDLYQSEVIKDRGLMPLQPPLHYEFSGRGFDQRGLARATGRFLGLSSLRSDRGL